MVRLLRERVRAGTECTIMEVQCVFSQGRGCKNQVSALRQVCEKHQGKGKDAFWAFSD